MFKKFTNACVNIVQKFLPDAFIFCIVLTIIVFVAAMPVSKMNPFEIANAWGDSMWLLLGFSMQMALVLVLGTTAPYLKVSSIHLSYSLQVYAHLLRVFQNLCM